MASRLLRRVGTIRARTTIAACLVVAIALAVSAILCLAVLRRSLVENLDDATLSRAEDVAAAVRQGSLPDTPSVPGEEDAIVFALRTWIESVVTRVIFKGFAGVPASVVICIGELLAPHA